MDDERVINEISVIKGMGEEERGRKKEIQVVEERKLESGKGKWRVRCVGATVAVVARSVVD